MSTALTTVGVGTGMSGVIGLRAGFDSPNDDPITRPSVLYGMLTGLGALGTLALKERTDIGGVVGTASDAIPGPFLLGHGLSALTAGTVSATFPKREGEELIIESRRQIKRR